MYIDRVSTISREAYDATLSKHHPWLVRKACNLAMYSLPLRSVLLHRIDSSENSEARIVEQLNSITESGKQVYDVTEELYTRLQLHDLPWPTSVAWFVTSCQYTAGVNFYWSCLYQDCLPKWLPLHNGRWPCKILSVKIETKKLCLWFGVEFSKLWL